MTGEPSFSEELEQQPQMPETVRPRHSAGGWVMLLLAIASLAALISYLLTHGS